MTLTEDLCLLLAALGLGTYAADDDDTTGDIYPTTQPAAPDEVLTVRLSPGGESDAVLPYDEPRLQVRVRGARNDVYAPEDRAWAVYRACHGLGGIQLLSGLRLVHLIGTQGGPVPMGQDADARTEFAVNFRAEVRRATTHRI